MRACARAGPYPPVAAARRLPLAARAMVALLLPPAACRVARAASLLPRAAAAIVHNSTCREVCVEASARGTAQQPLHHPRTTVNAHCAQPTRRPNAPGGPKHPWVVVGATCRCAADDFCRQQFNGTYGHGTHAGAYDYIGPVQAMESLRLAATMGDVPCLTQLGKQYLDFAESMANLLCVQQVARGAWCTTTTMNTRAPRLRRVVPCVVACAAVPTHVFASTAARVLLHARGWRGMHEQVRGHMVTDAPHHQASVAVQRRRPGGAEGLHHQDHAPARGTRHA